MSNNQGMVEQVVGTGFNLVYPFQMSGSYKVRLIAINGGCRDTTETFSFSVDDPTVDGTINLSSVQCFQQTSVKISFSVCNSGYATIPAGTPISFYDTDPRLPGAKKLDSTFLLPDSVLGRCCGKTYTINLDVQKLGLNSIYAVFNDLGQSLPVLLPNTTLPELNYTNNFTLVNGFKFTVSINPPNATLEPGDTLQLIGVAGPGSIASYAWNPTSMLSCADCRTPVFIAGKEDVKYRLIAVSNFGCIDSGFTDIKVPTADDYTIKINNVDCYRGDSLRAEFTICNEFKRGVLPAGLKVSFYDSDPKTGNAKLLGPVFDTKTASNNSCNTYIHIFKGPAPASIYAVVNDRAVIPFILPNDSLFLEKNYSNNITSVAYKSDSILLIPPDTLVTKNQTLPVSILSTVYDPASVNWLQGSGYSLSCTNCITTQITVSNSSSLKVEMGSKYGCKISGIANIRVFPPDMVIEITDTKCFTNDQTKVSFQLCMNNGYDSVLKGIPVSFYDANPSAGRAVLLGNTFRTPLASAGNCDTFSAIIRTPANGNIYAVVNDKGGSFFPDTAYAETDFTNNTDTAKAKLFTANITPADTTIYRTASVQLLASVEGGLLTSFSWQPLRYLSCNNCLTPIAKPPSTQEFNFTAKNENGCTAEATAIVRTYTDGKVHIPNAFTPNGDGKNDIFYILGSRDILMIKDFSIFNRYGQRVFHSTDIPPNNPVYGWNGTFGGKDLASGTFVYMVNIEFTDNHRELFKGNITLIR
jgi:gliding motility-associated-like protein